MKILWQYFSILISYSIFYVSLILFYFFIHISFFFFPLFFLLHTRTLNFFFLYFLLSSFSLPLPPHTCPYFFSLFPSFVFFPTTSPSRTFHKVSAPLSSLKVSASFFLIVRKLQGREMMMMMMMMMMKKKMKDWNIRKSLFL